MPGELTASLSSETLASGSAQEKATFGLFSLTANERLLTAGQDMASNEPRRGPYVAGYPLAEWFAWNWWRIRWEGGPPPGEDARRRWDFAHATATVGEGYAWPNITISSDGLRTFFRSEPTRNRGAVLFRYFGAVRREAVPAAQLEKAIDGFIENILTRLGDHAIVDSNLHRLWNDLEAERKDPETARFRRLEAQLGRDPDEADENLLRGYLDDAATLGEGALGEMAREAALDGQGQGRMLSAAEVSNISRKSGFDANLNDAVALEREADMPGLGDIEAWRVGESAARSLRDQLGLNGQPVSDRALAEFAGTTADAIEKTYRQSRTVSFVLLGRQGGDPARVALRSSWKTGRRFDLARLMGDRMLSRQMNCAGEQLCPATRARSYRQKAQRAFAAEFLSPFSSVDEMLNGDYSEEMQSRVARHFKVSPMTIQAQLANHDRIDLEEASDIIRRGDD